MWSNSFLPDLWRSEVRGEIAEKGRWLELCLQAFGEQAEVFFSV